SDRGHDEMSACDLDTSVPDWIIEHPETFAVFQRMGIDCSCGGKSLAYACQAQGLNPQVVWMELQNCLHAQQRDASSIFGSQGPPS
ncbi:MAG TPA: DUF542 domain-containing protein, partial [Chthoniobacteraceae bacterium]|nr:DUF542 domain-containing protein [Chthoniobacteraceae bacterium]